jgi:hypothetical protein
MPYNHELANPLGFLDLLSQDNKEWIEKRLKTYSRRESEQRFDDLFSSLLVTDPTVLSKGKSFTKVVAIDGSLSTIESPNVTAVKVASVWKDLSKLPEYTNGVLNPASLLAGTESVASVGLLPGAGIYPATGEGSWDTKFREEFYQNLRHIQTHRDSRRYSLVSFTRRILDSYATENPLDCPNCGQEKVDFEEKSLESVCSICGVQVYFTDYFTKALFAARTSPTQPMLLIERLMLHALIEETIAGKITGYSAEDTLFIADGSLQIFGLPDVAQIFLERIQKHDTFPAVVSFMKSGRVQELLQYPGIDEVIKPGTVAMITSEAWKMMFKTRGEAGIYGKAFAYRTKSGEKWFSFMVPPKLGDPVNNAPILNSWNNYPHIATICEFIEANQSNENGPTSATLEVIGRANKAASLPAEMSRKTLANIVHGVI